MTADGGLITAAGEAYDSGRKLITGAGKAHDSGRGGEGLFVCVSVFLMKAILSFFDFWIIFFLFIFALTFHKCQFVMKAILSFLIFGPFLLFFIFLFIFALTFHKCQIVKKAFLSFLFFGPFFFFSFLL